MLFFMLQHGGRLSYTCRMTTLEKFIAQTKLESELAHERRNANR